MKSTFFTILALLVLTLSVTSCYSSRRNKNGMGCPVNVKVNAQTETAKKAA